MDSKKHLIVMGKGGGTQVQADWSQSDSTQPDYIKNKPTVYNEWFGTQQEYDAILVKDENTVYHIEGIDVAWDDISNKPNFATVATSGDYTDLSNTPTIPTNTSDLNNDSGYITINDVPAQVNADWSQSDSSDPAYIENKPTIPAAQVNSDWNANSGVAQILNKPSMSTETLTFTLSDQSTVTLTVYVQPQQPQPTVGYFYVEDVSGQPNTLRIDTLLGSGLEPYCSTDGTNWTSMGTPGDQSFTATIPANGKVYLKSTGTQWGSDYDDAWQIYATGNHNIGGNIMSLLAGDDYEGATFAEYSVNYEYDFANVFGGNAHLIDASNLILPSELTVGCYKNMFQGCSSLTAAPVLPATTLADNCYFYMFNGCTALTTAPELPATTLASNCYSYMFQGCSSLTAAPALPATTLADSCYSNMFHNCKLLTTAPTLPATTLLDFCYENMFDGCMSLNSVTTYANDVSAMGCTSMWLQMAAATGDFYNLGGATYSSDESGIPSGWTEHTSL